MSTQKIAVLYGSETGNAQDLAERIWRQSKYFKFKACLLPLNDYNLNYLDNDCIHLFICSTTGQGDVPDNMINFWKLLMRKSIPVNSMNQLKYCVIGLGDSSYPKYNFTAKKLHKRLLQLGAESLLDICLCDDQDRDGYEGSYLKWIKLFWDLLKCDYSEYVKNNTFINSYEIKFVDSIEDNIINEASNIDESPATEKRPFYTRIKSNKRVTCTSHWQDVRLIDFDISNTNRMNYEAGDVLVIQPHNIRDNVDEFYRIFEHLKLNPKQNIEISCLDESRSKKILFNSIGDLVERYFDLNSVPRLSFFEIFRCFANDELESEKLDEFLSIEGREDLYEYCNRPRRTIIEVFSDFPKTTRNIIKLDYLIDLIPEIKPRSYSIASSPSTHKGVIQILVAVVEYKTRLHKPRRGTCTYWLSQLTENDDIRISTWIRKGSFKINWQKPIIAIGPGTGVAPFRSILYEKITYHKINYNYLYFGCRSKSKDFYFEHEWKTLANDKDTLSVYPAFSRDQEQKIYVQDLMKENSKEIYQLVHEGDAHIFIAGSSKRMPEDVLETIRQIIEQHANTNGDTKEYSNKFMNQLELSKRIQMETWY